MKDLKSSRSDKNREIDRLVAQLLSAHHQTVVTDDIQSSPFFVSRIMAKINRSQQAELSTRYSIERTWSWLIAVGFIALTLFICGTFPMKFTGNSDPTFVMLSAEENAVVDQFTEDTMALSDQSK